MKITCPRLATSAPLRQVLSPTRPGPMCRQGLEPCVDKYHIIHELASSLIVYNQSKPACKPPSTDPALDTTAMTLRIGSRASVWSACGLPPLLERLVFLRNFSAVVSRSPCCPWNILNTTTNAETRVVTGSLVPSTFEMRPGTS